MAKLTPKQSRFVDEYLVDLNATQAAIRAGYSEKTASRIGTENVQKPVVSDAIQQRMDKRSHRTSLTADDVVLQLGRMGMADPRRIYQDDGTPKPPHELDDDIAMAIQDIDTVTKTDGDGNVVTTYKYKLADRVKPLELIGKHLGKDLGQWAEKHEHDHDAGKSLTDLLAEVRAER